VLGRLIGMMTAAGRAHDFVLLIRPDEGYKPSSH
jgi:hypothetical protein